MHSLRKPYKAAFSVMPPLLMRNLKVETLSNLLKVTQPVSVGEGGIEAISPESEQTVLNIFVALSDRGKRNIVSILLSYFWQRMSP